MRLPMISSPLVGAEAKYLCAGTDRTVFLISRCLETSEWSPVEGQCPETEGDLDPIYTGNYQIGRENYFGEAEVEEQTGKTNQVMVEDEQLARQLEQQILEEEEEDNQEPEGTFSILCYQIAGT